MRINWHLEIPACRILAGIRRHLTLASMEDLSILCRFFGTNIEGLEERFWTWMKIGRRKQKDCRNCMGRPGGCNFDGLCESPLPLEKATFNEAFNAK